VGCPVAVTDIAYCSRTDAQRAIDFTDGLITNLQVDRAIQSAARNIEGHLHRLFYPQDLTLWWDWPNSQYAYPWRVWFDNWDCLCLTSFSSGTIAIPLNTCFLRPANPRPGFPYTSVELDRSSTSAFGGYAATPQNAIQAIGTWGFTALADEAATLTANITSSQTSVTVTNSALISAGDLVIIGYARGTAPYPSDTFGHAGLIQPYEGERCLVQDVALADTTLAQTGSGCTTANSADNQLTAGAAGLNTGEVVVLDSEEMLILALNSAGTTATVQRAWNGTVLATHSGAEVYAYRSLTLQRGILGTAAASATEGTGVYKHRVPALVRDLAIAESVNRILQETSGYSRMVGAGDSAMPASGTALADLWDEAMTEYGRKSRTRVV
jgi:hypothetical protein